MKWARANLRELGVYAAAGLLSIAAGVSVMELWKADLRVPFRYDDDSLLFALVTKGVVDHGWIWNNPNLGAPQGFALHDFPFAAHDTLHLFAIKLMSLFTRDWALLFNLYFLLGFPLITWAALAVFRRLGVGVRPALVGAWLYAFLPSRLLKGEGHIFLDAFFQVPLAVLLLLWVVGPEPPFSREPGAGRRLGLRFDDRRSRVALLICAVVATTALYYAFFTMVFALAGGLWASLERRSRRNVVSALVVTAVLAAGLGAQLLPTIGYRMRHGPNPEVSHRESWEAEVYGLKVTELLLPVSGHRIPALARLKQRYDTTAPLPSESATTSLGAVGSVGFLLLLGVALSGRRAPPADGDLLRPLGVLTVVAILLGTIGGFGSLLAYLVTPQIRTYARLNVFIGFFALCAVVVVLDRLAKRRPAAATWILAAVFAVGLGDQATRNAVAPYAAIKRQYATDRNFVRRIEAALPNGASVFELPFSTFPEPPRLNRMSGYAPLRPYLHSNTLRWSYPAMRGRSGDAWAQSVAERPPDRMVSALHQAGVAGILIHRDGYADAGAAIEAGLRAAVRREPLASADGRLLFFLVPDEPSDGAQATPEQISEALYRAQHPIAFSWGQGFYGLEREPHRSFRWSQAQSELLLENEAPFARRISLTMAFAPAHAPAHLRIRGAGLAEDVDLDSPGVSFARTLDVPPGRQVIRFSCDGSPANAPMDPRTMVWTVESFAFDELPAVARSP